MKIFKDDSIKWSIDNEKTREIISILYPFFDIETRHIDLYDWDNIWSLVCRLSSFNIKKVNNDEVISFLDEKISNGNGSYKEYISQVEKIIDTKNYSYQEKVLSYIKVGLKGHNFTNVGEELSIQSDGTNSHKFIELLLTLLITLTRREFITPTVYIDEPEIGLHPKLNEALISTIHTIYSSFEKTTDKKEKGKYKTPYPKLFISTHSPNILKSVIKSFKEKQQILHFSKEESCGTLISKLNSKYEDHRFFNVFSDNEVRLFFSDFILFVEGSTELEVFSNEKLNKLFPVLTKIDIHCFSNETLKYINPNYSRASIPFQILYDADVVFELDYDNEKLSFKHGAVNINNINRELSLRFLSYKNTRYNTLKQIKEHISKPIKFSENNVSYDEMHLPSLIKATNYILSDENILLTQTTIEGALINKQSLPLFRKWICFIFMNELYMTNKIPCFNIKAQKIKLDNNRTTVREAIESIFTSKKNNIEMSQQDRETTNKILKTHLYDISSKIKKFTNNDKNLELNIWRVIFDGKTDTLLSKDNAKYQDIMVPEFVTLIKEIRTLDLKAISPRMGKTGGWVTSFIDYSISQLESKIDSELEPKKKKNKLKNDFSIVFPELSAIVTNASSSIE